jgi:hypothetical protein
MSSACLLTDWRISHNWLISSTVDSKWSQNYFTTGGLPPDSSSWRQAPWGSRSEIVFQLKPCGHSPYVTSSLTRRWGSLMNMLALYSSALIAHVARYWKFFLLYYMQVPCQYRLRRADHVYLTYLMLQRQFRHLSHHQVYSWLRLVLYCGTVDSQLTVLVISRHGPHRKHRSSVALQLFPWEHICLRSRYSETALVYLLISRSLPNNESTCNYYMQYCLQITT